MKISNLLELKRESHDTLGEVLVLYSPAGDEGSAYYVETSEVEVETKRGKKVQEQEVGVGIRLSKETATKLAWNLLRALGEVDA